MMKKTLIALMLTIGFWAVSCGSDDNTPAEQVNPYDKFEGTWTGTFSGDTEGGTWTATFDKNGKATGALSTESYEFDLEGEVSENGEISATYYTDTTLVGEMSGIMTETTASGTWKSPLLDIQGTWEGTKQ